MVTRTTFNPTKTFLMDALNNNIVTIKFFKKDGSEREMKCTLQESFITPYEKKTDRERVISDTNISVWDIENQGWRSFRYDSIISINV